MIVSEHPQGSPMWHAERCGLITASQFHRVITPAKLQRSTQWATYLSELLAQWILGQPEDEFAGNYWTDRGTDLEPEARRAFSVATGLHAERIGFGRWEGNALVGASLDATVHEAPGGPTIGLLELKCPKLSTHLGYWDAGTLPSEYRMQVQGQMLVAGVSRGWFMSYHPDGPEVLVEVEADSTVQSSLAEALVDCVAEMVEKRKALRDAGIEPRDPLEWAMERDEWE